MEPEAPTAISEGDLVTLTATAAAADGIERVEFYCNAVLIATDTTAPYSTTWTAVGGQIAFTARAYSNHHYCTDSAPVMRAINYKPVIQFTAPTAGQVITAGTAITLTAAADPDNGQVPTVTFTDGTTPIGTVTAPAPGTTSYSFDWAGASAGTHTVTATATDPSGAAATAEVTFRINAKPTVQMTMPADGSTIYAGSRLLLGADAADREDRHVSPASNSGRSPTTPSRNARISPAGRPSMPPGACSGRCPATSRVR